MTQQQRSEYSATSIKQQKRIEARHTRAVYDALRITVDDFLDDARRRGLTAATSTLYTVIGNEALTEQLREIHQESGLFFGRKAWREIQRSVKSGRKDWNMSLNASGVYESPYMVEKAGFGLNLKWIADILNWFAQDLLQTVSRITETTRMQILDVLAEAQTNGHSFEWVENKLTSPKLLAWRARLIARTETAKGAFVGRKLAHQDSEWETDKEWIAANDHRTRHGHRLVDGELIDNEARFQVPYKNGTDMMEGPGDPTANVANLANCRCALAAKARRDSDGRLIRKQTQIPVTTNIN